MTFGIAWDDPTKRYYQHGLDRGAVYIGGWPSVAPIPWNGLISVDEGGEGSTEMLYRDGVVYFVDADASDFVAQVNAIMYPDGFGKCIGIPKVADGFYADDQKPIPFHLTYRTLVGSGSAGDMFGYQIHLVYNCMATVGQRKRNSIGKDTAPTDFTFNIVCKPERLEGYRPTAHYVIDTRFLSSSTIQQLEEMLYGTPSTPGAMPDPTTVFEMLNFGDAMVFHVHTDGTYTVTASSDNVFDIDGRSFYMVGPNGVDNGDGTYTISDGGNTDVIIDP